MQLAFWAQEYNLGAIGVQLKSYGPFNIASAAILGLSREFGLFNELVPELEGKTLVLLRDLSAISIVQSIARACYRKVPMICWMMVISCLGRTGS